MRDPIGAASAASAARTGPEHAASARDPIAPSPSPAPAARRLVVDDLGVLGYRDAWARQLACVEARKAGAGDDTLMLVEHPHVITLGRAQKARGNVLAAGDVEVIEIERGGDVTYHGPGQLVAYPIVRLEEGERDLHRFLRNLEEAVIRTLADLGLAAGREPGKTGVWLDARDGARKKICSMGIACRRWVTFHGLALNVATDLGYFHRINPCGFDSSVMTSLSAELGRPVTLAAVKPLLSAHLATTLSRTLA
ncbi:MAG TPA: lipoyl(octanoyl) transferase LipB [Kofleriaceae bacterium]|nr:lipoyl(octanoyl) transferase LipB [Kofleriaceae bacterium]